MINVLLFTHHLVSGGAEKTLREIAWYFNTHPEYRIHTSIAVVYDDRAAHEALDGTVETHVLNTASAPGDSRMKKLRNVIRQIGEFRRLKTDLAPDICVSFLPGADIINVLSGTRVKKVVSVRSQESHFAEKAGKKIYVRTAYILCDYITAASEAIKRDIVSFFHADGNKIAVIPNWAAVPEDQDSIQDPQAFDRYLRFIAGRKTIISVGRLHPVKGQVHLLRAFSAVADEEPQTVLVFVGDGPEKERLVSLTESLGLSERVFFAGDRRPPYAYMKKADVFVLPSNVEGMPNVILEAMLCGLPVIATRCGAEELLGEEERGVLTAPCASYTDQVPEEYYDHSYPLTDNEQAFASVIAELIRDPDRRRKYAEAGRSYAMEYAPERIAGKWADLFEKLSRR